MCAECRQNAHTRHPPAHRVQTCQHVAGTSEATSLCGAVATAVAEAPQSAAHGAAALAAACSCPHAPPDPSQQWATVLTASVHGSCLGGALAAYAHFAASVKDASQVARAVPHALMLALPPDASSGADAAFTRSLAAAQTANSALDAGGAHTALTDGYALHAIQAAADTAQRRSPGGAESREVAQKRLVQWMRAAEGFDLAQLAVPTSGVVRGAHQQPVDLTVECERGKENGGGEVVHAIAALQALVRARAVDEARMHGVQQVLASLQQL